MSQQESNAVTVSHVSRAFGERKALDDVSISVPRGELVAFLGPNGSGKTTLFRILATLLEPDAGDVEVMGHAVGGNQAAVRGLLGIVFQKPSIDPFLSVGENMLCQGRLYGLSGQSLADRIDRRLARFRLGDRINDRASVLSGGLQRRLELAKGLLHDPRVLLLDEPSTGLDPAARAELMDELTKLREEDGVTCLLTTHLMEEAQRCDRVAVLSEGKLVDFDTPANLKSRVGGDVIVMEPLSADSDATRKLASNIDERFGLQARAVDGAVRIECPEGHRRVPELYEAFREKVDNIRVGPPTLSDVFFHLTGRPLIEKRDDLTDEARRSKGRRGRRR